MKAPALARRPGTKATVLRLLDAELIGVTALGLTALLVSLSTLDLLLKIAVSAATLLYILIKIASALARDPRHDDEDSGAAP